MTMPASDQPEITVRKIAYQEVLNLDEDGTPLYKGERMVEIRPGVWTTALEAAVLKFLGETGPSLQADTESG
jgi:hypothetical protein